MVMVTVTTAAPKLGCAPSTMRALEDGGVVRHVIVEPRDDRLFAVDDLETFLRQHKRQARRPGKPRFIAVT